MGPWESADGGAVTDRGCERRVPAQLGQGRRIGAAGPGADQCEPALCDQLSGPAFERDEQYGHGAVPGPGCLGQPAGRAAAVRNGSWLQPDLSPADRPVRDVYRPG